MIDVHFDYETFSEADIKKVGTAAYAEHPSTEVICMSYAYGDEEPKLWLPGQPIPNFLKEETHGKYRLFAHNSLFEYLITKHVMKLTPAPIECWMDTAAISAALSMPRALFGLCQVIGIRAKESKDPFGGFLIRKLCIPVKYTKKAQKALIAEMSECDRRYLEEMDEEEWPEYIKTYRNRDPELLERLYGYCRQDVVAERSCTKFMLPLSKAEQVVWQTDQVINLRGVNVDIPLVNDCIAIYEKQVETLTTKLKDLTGLDNPNSQQQFLGWAKERGYTQDNLQAETLRDFLKEYQNGVMTYNFHQLTDAIELKVSLGKTAPKKFYALLRRLSKDGRHRGAFMFHGAGTGRWASLGINLQNLMRPAMEDVDLVLSKLPERDPSLLEMYWGDSIEAIASCIRGMLIPSPGHRFLICDYSQVEARIIAWLAGEESTLKIFRDGKDIYVHAASQIFEIEELAVGKDERFSGKTAILACGFQGGWAALQKMAKNYGKVLEDEFCNMIVKKWRRQNPNIVAYWRALEDAAIDAIRNPGKTCTASDYLETPNPKLPDVQYRVGKGFLFCKLPSGRKLAYADPKAVKKTIHYFKIGDSEDARSIVFNKSTHGNLDLFQDLAEKYETTVKSFDTFTIRFFGSDPQTKQWVRQYTYGGSLAENVTQAVARDLLSHAMVNAERKDYPIVIHVHDELVADKKIGEGSFDEFKAIMLDSPAWAKGLPLDADGEESERFKK